MRYRNQAAWVFLFLSLGLLFTLGSKPPKQLSTGYWIWAGVPLEQKHKNQLLYLYQGRFYKQNGQTAYSRRGLFPHPLKNEQGVYLVYRFATLDLSPRVVNTMRNHIFRWEEKGVPVLGIQLDFDSPTARLSGYVEKLKILREQLPASYRISITGLADWVMSGRKEDLMALGQQVDELVFQMYHDVHDIPREADFLSRLTRLNIPVKLGLLERMDPEASKFNKVRRMPGFQGMVFFLRNDGSKTAGGSNA
jgi:hypothetical protein